MLQAPQAPDDDGDAVSWIVLDELRYFDRPPWPPADGTGWSLQRIDPAGDGNAADNWMAADPTPGSPAAVVTLSAPARDSVLVVPLATDAVAAVHPLRVSGSVHRVTFFAGTNVLGVRTNPPYAWPLNALTAEQDVALAAELTDDAGAHRSRAVPIRIFGIPDAAWPHRLKAAFPGYDRPTVLSNFPALVTFGPHIDGFSYGGFAPEPAATLRFTDESVSRPLPYEIEAWDTNGVSTLWVRVPELTDRTNCVWAWWGGSNALAVPPYAVDGSTWAPDHEAVWHLTGGAADSSSNRHAAAAAAVTGATGVAAGALRFDGAASLLVPDLEPPWYGANIDGLTVSLWARRAADFDGPFGVNPGGGGALYVKSSRSGWSFGAGGGASAQQTTTPETWQLWTLVLDDNQARGYRDGELRATFAYADFTPGDRPVFGGVAPAQDFFNGDLDEIRISRVARSADWIRACARSGLDHAAFTTYALAGAPGAADDDDDGMADGWEQRHFGGTSVTNGGPLDDWDGDGHLNLWEYVAGTDPTNRLDVFAVDVEAGGGAAAVSFFAVATNADYAGFDRYYGLQNATGLFPWAWTDVSGFSNVPGLGQWVIYSNAATPGLLFFRGRVWLEELQ